METKRKRKPPLEKRGVFEQWLLEKRGVFEQWLLEKRGVFEQWLLEEPLAGRVAYNDKSLITNFTVPKFRPKWEGGLRSTTSYVAAVWYPAATNC